MIHYVVMFVCFCEYTHILHSYWHTDWYVDNTFCFNLSCQKCALLLPLFFGYCILFSMSSTSRNALVCRQQLDLEIVHFRTYNIVKLQMRVRCVCVVCAYQIPMRWGHKCMNRRKKWIRAFKFRCRKIIGSFFSVHHVEHTHTPSNAVYWYLYGVAQTKSSFEF